MRYNAKAMKRALRILFNAAAVLALLLCVAMVALWVRGHRLQEYVSYTFGRLSPAVGNYPGGIFLAWNQNNRTTPGFSYLGYKEGESPLLRTHRLGDFAYRNDSYPSSTPGGPPIRIRAIMFPTWVAVLACALTSFWSFRLSLRLRPPRPGVCHSCGFDLRATPDRCPECGTIPTQ
jgi:hypothetical protein